MARHPADYELDFLYECTSEELDPIVGAILGTVESKDAQGNVIRGPEGTPLKEIDTTGRISSKLDDLDVFKKNYPNHKAYVDEIIEEIQLYGGHTAANLFRGYGVLYHEVLVDAAEKQGVNFKATQKTEAIEGFLLAKVLDDVWAKMTPEQRQKIIDSAAGLNLKIGGFAAGALVGLINAGGFASYQIMLIIVNAVSRALFGRGLALAANAGLAQFVGVIAGPVGWLLSGLWAAWDLGSTAYRVTVPVCIYIAALRQLKKAEKAHPEYLLQTSNAQG